VLPTLLAQARRDIYGSGAWGVQPGDTVLDCGAYVGTTARQALARGARLIVAIEPTPESVECLRRNLAGEIAAGKVIVYPKGVWDSETELTFSVNPANLAGNSFLGSPSGPKQLSIPVTPSTGSPRSCACGASISLRPTSRERQSVCYVAAGR